MEKETNFKDKHISGGWKQHHASSHRLMLCNQSNFFLTFLIDSD